MRQEGWVVRSDVPYMEDILQSPCYNSSRSHCSVSHERLYGICTDMSVAETLQRGQNGVSWVYIPVYACFSGSPVQHTSIRATRAE